MRKKIPERMKKMTNQTPRKGVLITILVLLVIFAPLSVVSFLLHKNKPVTNPIVENTNHEFYFEGKLYFYNENNELLGTYTCQSTKENCNYAISKIEDENYSLDSYQTEETRTKIIQNRYAFLEDATTQNEKTPFLYDIPNERIITKYQSINNYGIGIEDNLMIVKNDNNKYGVISLAEEPKVSINLEYDFIGLPNIINEDKNQIMNDLFVGLKEEKWYLLDSKGAILTSPIEREIVSFNGKHIITKEDKDYYLVDYQGKDELDDSPYLMLSFTSKYLNILDGFNDFYVKDLATTKDLIEPIHIKNTDTITSQINEDGDLEIIQNDKVVQTVAIS